MMMLSEKANNPHIHPIDNNVQTSAFRIPDCLTQVSQSSEIILSASS
jgi:hypothetical protein